MESKALAELMVKIEERPVLENRLAALQQKIKQAEETVIQLKSRYDKEAKDVNKLIDESFTALFFRVIGKYEGKLTKEKGEELEAKLRYDDACDRINKLNEQQEEMARRIDMLKAEEKQYRDELELRRDTILRDRGSVIFKNYMDIEESISQNSRMISETQEAIKAAERAKETADSAIVRLEKAESWATYDVFTNNSFLVHEVKYENMDEAQSILGRLGSQIKDLRKELSDIDLQLGMDFKEADGTTRMIDFWFDNIYTDMNVRSMIQENISKTDEISCKLDTIIRNLKSKLAELNNKNIEFENEKDRLLINS